MAGEKGAFESALAPRKQKRSVEEEQLEQSTSEVRDIASPVMERKRMSFSFKGQTADDIKRVSEAMHWKNVTVIELAVSDLVKKLEEEGKL